MRVRAVTMLSDDAVTIMITMLSCQYVKYIIVYFF